MPIVRGRSPYSSVVIAVVATLVLAMGDFAPAQTGPASMTPSQVGIAYDIVASRMPVAGNQNRDAFPDAVNSSLYVGRGTELVLIHPNGSEEVLYSAGANGACVDPCVSFDGKTVYFSRFDDPENINTQRGVSWSPAHIFKVDVITHVATQLTFGSQPSWQDTAHQVNPQYASFDLAPIELPDGHILFLSSRDDVFSANRRMPSMRFWRMNKDGTDLEAMENFTQASCQHPIVLRDGRIVWTHGHPAGRRAEGEGNYPLMIARPDLSSLHTFAGDHFPSTAWHFATQMSNEDVVTTVYYHQNNFGHGTLVRIPLYPGTANGQVFYPTSNSSGFYQIYGSNDHFRRVGEVLVTPWSLDNFTPSLDYDSSSVLLSDGTRAGKCTMPAGAPGGNLLLVWSNGNVNDLDRPTPELPHMKVCYAANGMLPNRNDLVILKQSASYQYMYPKPVVPYSAIFGVAKPAIIPDTPNDGASTPALPAGSPYATIGTSSVYNRESHWPAAYQDPFDVNIVNNYSLDTAFFIVGQDSYAFPNSAIYAAQVVADMTHVDTRYANLDQHFISHNNGSQVWGVLGEIPLRKYTAQGAPIMDPQGNPDTSYEVRIPANVPVHNRIVDQNGLLLTAEWTWHSARPGERKTDCGGCHAHSINTTPLPFSQTAAAQPGYVIQDFAQSTPLIDHDAQGSPSITVLPERVKVVEYHADIQPIFAAKCVSCHGGAAPAAGLDLVGNNAYDHLAFTDATNTLFGFHQVTRYVRIHASTQSLLVWKCFGQRLDGRTNATRTGDIDYTGTIMPPPNSGIPPLTFMEKRLIALWIDLGCLVDTTPGQATIGDPFDDQMAPTLAVGGVAAGYNAAPLSQLTLGVFDLHSGINATSLDVRVTPFGGVQGPNLAAGLTIQNGQVLSFGLPGLGLSQRHTVDVSVKDVAGNTTRRKLEITPLAPASLSTLGAGTPGTGGIAPSLAAVPLPRIGTDPFTISVGSARPGSAVYLFASTTPAPAPVTMAPLATLYLNPATLFQISQGTTSASGAWSVATTIPETVSIAGSTLVLQAVVQDPAGPVLGPAFQGTLTNAITMTIGW